jgi:hypothetical protein
MKILVTGSYNYDGLCSGLKEVLYDRDVTYVSRSNGYDLTDIDSIVELTKGYDIFVNSLNIPNNGQLKLLNSVYDRWSSGHIINISTTSVFWNNQKNIEYYHNKSLLEQRSKELSNLSIETGQGPRVSCIAFGALDTASQRLKNDGRTKMSVVTAAIYVKLLIDSPPTTSINYLCLDPIQIKN